MLEFDIKEERLLKPLIVITITLTVLYVINKLIGQPSWQITLLLDVGREDNLPTWFSSIILFIAAFWAHQCSVISSVKRDEKIMWQLLSLGFLGMSCDEVAQIHERLGNTINKYFFQLDVINSAWVIILGPAVLLVIILFSIKMKKYLTGSNKAIKYLAFGAFLYICGAFAFEATTNFLNHNSLEWLWKIEIPLEELFEMLGVIFIIKGLIEHYKFLLQDSKEQ